MEITGRIVADAKISTVKGDKEVVNFTVVSNDRYRSKGAKETKEFSTYFNIAWWMGTNIAKVLTKGSIVSVSGRLFVYKCISRSARQPKSKY
jgi:single-strand DNA-binding protein